VPVAGNAAVPAGFKDGVGALALFNEPRGVAVAADGLKLYVHDNGNCAIREIDLATFMVTTLVGSPPSADGLALPDCDFVDGVGLDARIGVPSLGVYNEGGITLSKDGRTLYLADVGAIRAINLATRKVTTLVGGGFAQSMGWVEGAGANAKLDSPIQIAELSRRGALLFADYTQDTIGSVTKLRSPALIIGLLVSAGAAVIAFAACAFFGGDESTAAYKSA
jgi:hypothetical protein